MCPNRVCIMMIWMCLSCHDWPHPCCTHCWCCHCCLMYRASDTQTLGLRTLMCLCCRILLHFHLEPQLIVSSHVFILLFSFRSQGTPPFTKNSSHLDKLDTRIITHDNRPHLVGEEHIGTRCTLWCRGVFRTSFVAFSWTMILYHVAPCIMTWRGDIGSNFSIKSSLVLCCPSIPTRFFLWGEVLVHVGCVLGKLSESHSWILTLELISHGVLVQ
mmetsp:Transcript_12853/g.26637  ORF Transcript_12853/g.26637 Transcript_12853/m.26637 type:complete len:215 (-) Transcript_12853:484-1128(-)